MSTLTDRRKAALIIGGFVLFQSCFLAIFLRFGLRHFLVHLGFLAGKHAPRRDGYAAAAIVAVAFIAISARLPSVRENLVRISWLKLLALALAVVAGSLEEIVFRGLLMDGLQNIGIGAVLQIILSGVAFGLVHGIWALFRGSWRAGLGAITATGILGAALGVVYIVGSRSLAPCVTAHFWINVFSEPGLMLAAIRGEMGRGLTRLRPENVG